MTDTSTSRTIRFKKDDLRDIEEFLVQNPVFDFSTLVRISIRKFIEKPELVVRAVKRRCTEKRKTGQLL